MAARNVTRTTSPLVPGPAKGNGSRGVSESFKARANEAAYWEAWVGAVLARAGLYTMHHPFLADGSDSHGLSWDLDVSSEGVGGPWRQVEVKSLNLKFNNIDDYPFNTVIVCSQNSWRKKWGQADMTQRDFLFVSRETGSIVWLPTAVPVISGCHTVDRSRNEQYLTIQTTKNKLKDLHEFIEHVQS